MTDHNSSAPKKPGFFKRLFGGTAGPEPSVVPDTPSDGGAPAVESAAEAAELAWDTAPFAAPASPESVEHHDAHGGGTVAEAPVPAPVTDQTPPPLPATEAGVIPAPIVSPDIVDPSEPGPLAPETEPARPGWWSRLARPLAPEPAEGEPPPPASPPGGNLPAADLPAADLPVADLPVADLAAEELAAEELAGGELSAEVLPAEDLPAANSAIADSAEADIEAPRPTWWSRLKRGMARSSSSIGTGITDIFTKRKLDAATLEDLDDILIRADLGVATAGRITDAIGRDRFNKAIDPAEIKAVLAGEVERVLEPLAVPLVIDRAKAPFTILMIGVNGSGKTTTIGKLASKFTASGHKVMLAAGDTFRAAAVEQLKVWGARTGAPVVTRDQGADAAGLAFDAVKQAQAAGTDVLLIDTAGRLQNRTELMDELAKILRVLRKVDPEAPHAVLLVLDATVGQNAMSQVEIFGRTAGVTGLVMTKLDGTARGGILVAIAEKFNLPIHFIGIGEGVDDLEPFAARDFARAIAGLEDA